VFLFLSLFLIGCVSNPPAGNGNIAIGNTNANVNTPSANANTNTQTAVAPPVDNTPITMPVLDAMFADEAFGSEIKGKVGLSDEEFDKVKQAARNDVLKLDESDANSSTAAATKRTNEELKKIIGDEKTKQLLDLARQRWSGSDQNELLNGRPNFVPTDTRIVVNAPAYRMDIYQDGKLTKTFKVGIGYPEFPLPRGLRKAEKIIFNPVWTPPDEPWVKGKYEPYKKVEAGSKDNPLGLIKIPIGLPSLIHGGKNPARLGTFASHGCVGLTNQQVEAFAQELAQLAGNNLTPADIKNYQKDKSKTEEVKLQKPVLVELRYETIVVENGKVHIYRDVYELGTNTEDDLRRVLTAYDVELDQLDANVKSQLLDALKLMAVDAHGQPVSDEDTKKSNSPSKSGKVTTTIKGKKEIVIDVPQLAGKGYPPAVSLMG